MTKSQKELLEEVIQKICKREQWEYVDHVQAQYLANTFLENKEIRQNHSEILQYFKLEDLQCLKHLHYENDILCKVDLKDFSFSVRLYHYVKKCV